MDGTGIPILDAGAPLDAVAREALEGGAPAAVRRAGCGLGGSGEPCADAVEVVAKSVAVAASSEAGGESLIASSLEEGMERGTEAIGTGIGTGAGAASSTEVSQLWTSRCWCDGCLKTRDLPGHTRSRRLQTARARQAPTQRSA